MATPVSEHRPSGMEDNSTSDFYLSSNLDTLQHAKSLRNSVIIRDYSVNSIASLQNNITPNPMEQKTGLIKMTTSPSLSALAGILNEKTKNADMMVRQLSINALNDPIQEELESNPSAERFNISKDGEIKSPNLIDLEDGDAVVFKHSIPSDNFVDQPDFLNTPKVRQETISDLILGEEPLDHELPSYEASINGFGDNVDSGANYHTSNVAVQEEVNSFIDEGTKNSINEIMISSNEEKHESSTTGSPITVVSSHNASSTIIETNAAVLEKLNKPIKTETQNDPNKSKRRRSILNFWKKSKAPSEKQISNSSSFSVNSSERRISLSSTTEKPLNKKSLSSTSIFSTFRKAKSQELTKNATPVKTSSQVLPKNKKNPKNKQIQQRKPTPLDFEKALPEISTDKIATDVFPKSLNVDEIDSIVSIERSRSIRSNQRNSLSSLRTRSLSDHISLNAKMEGMIVKEASGTLLATPDLTKSPTSSILRNGKFENIPEMNVSPRSILESDSNADVVGLAITSSQRDFSFGSIEEKLRELTVESEHEEEITTSFSVQNATKFSNFDEDKEDNELISDIMEFASIIDFGEDIEFDFDVTSNDNNKYETLNPSRKTKKSTISKSELSIKPLGSIPSGSVSALGVDNVINDQLEYEKGMSEGSKEEVDNAFHFNRNGIPIITKEILPPSFSSNTMNIERYEEDDFENEDFNNLHISKESPKINAFLPDINHTMSRPISMSFRGLKAPQFNSNLELSAMVSYDDYDISTNASTKCRTTARTVLFSSQIILYETYGEFEYDRHPDTATCNQLTPQLAQMIKEELNDLKAEMEVHAESKCYTHFL